MNKLFDYRKLKGKITEAFGTHKAFAKAMNWSERTTSLKMNGEREWKQSEICKEVCVLSLNDGDIPEYFFRLKADPEKEVRASE